MNYNMKQFVLFLWLSKIVNIIGFTSLPSASPNAASPTTTSPITTNTINQFKQNQHSSSSTELSVSIFSTDVFAPFSLLFASWLLFVDVATNSKNKAEIEKITKPRRLSREKATLVPLPSTSTATVVPEISYKSETSTEVATTSIIALTTSPQKELVTKKESNKTTIDVSTPYDPAARLASDEWRGKYGRGDFDENKYEAFIQNYETVIVANAKAAKDCRDNKDAPPSIELDELDDTKEGIAPATSIPNKKRSGFLASLSDSASKTDAQAPARQKKVKPASATFPKKDLLVAKKEPNRATIDVSIPYDAAAKLAYDEWRGKYGKGDFDEKKYETFKQNYEAMVIANVKAAKDRRDGKDAPPVMELDKIGDTKKVKESALVEEAASNVIRTNNKVRSLEGGKRRRMIKSFFTSAWNIEKTELPDDIDTAVKDAEEQTEEKEKQISLKTNDESSIKDVKGQKEQQETQPSLKKEQEKQSLKKKEVDLNSNANTVNPAPLLSSKPFGKNVNEEETKSTKKKSNIQTFSQQTSEKQSITTTSRLLNKSSNIKHKVNHRTTVPSTAESKVEESQTESKIMETKSYKFFKPKAEVYVPPKINWKRETPFVQVYTKDNPLPKAKSTTTPKAKSTNPKQKTGIKQKEEKQEKNSKAIVITSPLVTRKSDKIKNTIKHLSRNSKRVTTTLSVMFSLFLASSHSSTFSSSTNNVVNNGKQFIASSSESIKDFSPILDKSIDTSAPSAFTTVTEKQIELSVLAKKRIMNIQQQEKQQRRCVYVATTTTANERKEELKNLLKVEKSDDNNDDEIFIPFSAHVTKSNA